MGWSCLLLVGFVSKCPSTKQDPTHHSMQVIAEVSQNRRGLQMGILHLFNHVHEAGLGSQCVEVSQCHPRAEPMYVISAEVAQGSCGSPLCFFL